uniref:Uncharacterized protein n=1 Tax=viral metagenome TaxID=1070528 RepID=A0A6C0EU20_9ZZZZ
MSYSFKNVVLLVVFNYSNCTCNKDVILKLYETYFKKIIFYSDLPEILDDDINYININRGYNTHNIFKHFYNKYNDLINESDGLFYTMDDNIINVNILNLYLNNKIIYFHNELTNYEKRNEEWWYTPYGLNAVKNLINDSEFKRFNIDSFCGGNGYVGFSDFFYLPKKYLIKELFDLFEIFSKHEVFLEIAVPTIINNIEKNITGYQHFTHYNAWPNRDFFIYKDNIFNSANKDHNLFLHPIKFNQNPISKEWLKEIFCKEKCVIITTINKPSETILKHINNTEYDVIIVGDNKTPDDYKSLNCIYLDISTQKKLFPELTDLLPYNHYCRKNLGYMYAIKKGYEIIYETDDDNIPYDNFDNILLCNNIQIITEQNNRWINIFKYFTNNAYIWPRGYPLSLLKNNPNYLVEDTLLKPSIINGLVENDPDVDALFRIICNHQNSIHWDTNKKILVSNNNVCVFNTQNTFWLNASIFICMLIPSSVSFRYCDILRGIISNIILKKTNNYMMYSSPNVTQYRNEHILINDFKSECEMYIHNENILNFIEDNINKCNDIKDIIVCIYNNLLTNSVITTLDITILHKWLEYF